MDTIAIVRCTFRNLGPSVGQNNKRYLRLILVTIAIVRVTIATEVLTLTATGQLIGQTDCGSLKQLAVYRVYFGAYC